MNSGLDPNVLAPLETDSTPLWVGPFPREKDEFKEMTVQEVLTEMQNDPLFQLRVDYGESVHLDYVKIDAENDGSKVIVGRLPEYPAEMARERVAGDVTAKVIFKGGRTNLRYTF